MYVFAPFYLSLLHVFCLCDFARKTNGSIDYIVLALKANTCGIYVCICFYSRFERATFSASFTAPDSMESFLRNIFHCAMCNLYIFFLLLSEQKKTRIPSECDGECLCVCVCWMHYWMTQSVVCLNTVSFVEIYSRIPLRNNWFGMRFNPTAERRDHTFLTTFSSLSQTKAITNFRFFRFFFFTRF